MKISRMLMPTLKEEPQEAEIPSHKLMLRSGMIRRMSAGIYNYLPLGWRVVRKVENIIRQEMNAINGQELLMPAMNPRELWEESGRWELLKGSELFTLKDRWGRDFCLGMTHEEAVTDIARRELHSYRDLPIILYQIQTKFRDEPRPRGGVMRGREFLMKDAYSFHSSDESLNEVYKDFYRAYGRIFNLCGMDTVPVEADSGAIGGSVSHEFMVLSDSGEDTVFLCSGCGYSANREKASFKVPDKQAPQRTAGGTVEKVHTPGVSSIEKLEEFLKISADRFIKAMVYMSDEKPVMALLRGDHDLNEAKLRNALNVKNVRMATPEEILSFTGGAMGFSGPVGMKPENVVADHDVKYMVDAVCGANMEDYHLKGVNPDADFQVSGYHQLREAVQGDLCPLCGKMMDVRRSIELGHIFKLGRKYSDSFRAVFLDQDGSEKTFIMGCYGIGVTRVVGAVIEANHDDYGIIWPMTVAPYECVVIPVMHNDENQRRIAETMYDELREKGIDVVFDDRDSRPGFKFKDADLIGYPLRVVVGRDAVENEMIELKLRREKDKRMIPLKGAVEHICQLIQEEKALIYSKADEFEGVKC